jgi:hypothetical protein
VKGEEEGGSLCDWLLKVSPAVTPRCQASEMAAPAACSAAETSQAYGAAVAGAAAEATKRFDCFPCTLAWLNEQVYHPPANGGVPWDLIDNIQPFLAREYGSIVPQGPRLPCWRQEAQSKGIPVSMSYQGIVNEIHAAGNGARGVVLIQDPSTGDIGHVFGVKNVGSSVQFWDPQQQMDGSLWLKTYPGAWVSFFRIQ